MSCWGPLPRPSPQRRGPPRPPQSCRCQRSSWGASRAGRRLPVPRARPPHPQPLHLTRARPTQLAPGPARPDSPSRGTRANGRPLAPGAPRSPPRPPPPSAHGGRGGQRRFLAPALGGGRWRFETGPPGLPFQAARSYGVARARARSLALPDEPHRPAPPPPPPRSILPGPSSAADSRGNPGEPERGKHLRHNRRGGLPASSAPSSRRSRLVEGVREGRGPGGSPSLEAIGFSIFSPPPTSSSATHSPCCKGYRFPRREHTTARLARSTRTSSPPRPPAPHKHLPPPDPSASRQITERSERVPAGSPPPLPPPSTPDLSGRPPFSTVTRQSGTGTKGEQRDG